MRVDQLRVHSGLSKRGSRMNDVALFDENGDPLEIGGGGEGGLTVIKAVQPGNPATPMALGTDTDVNGWPALVASAAFSPETACLVVVGMGGLTDTATAVGLCRLVDDVDDDWLNGSANTPYNTGSIITWAATKLSGAQPIPPFVITPGDYTLELRAGSSSGGTVTHLAAFLAVLAIA